ncbi:DUF2312 domain-containing protein [Sinorhizobium meliloti]|nr:DUF2312 domain-containing protein [Sinorhizobium meliloti]
MSDEQGPVGEVQGSVAADELRSFIERIQRLEEEAKTIKQDITDVFGEAKSRGYDVKIMKMVLRILKQDKDERMEQESVLDTYLQALGIIPRD